MITAIMTDAFYQRLFLFKLSAKLVNKNHKFPYGLFPGLVFTCCKGNLGPCICHASHPQIRSMLLQYPSELHSL